MLADTTFAVGAVAALVTALAGAIAVLYRLRGDNAGTMADNAAKMVENATNMVGLQGAVMDELRKGLRDAQGRIADLESVKAEVSQLRMEVDTLRAKNTHLQHGMDTLRQENVQLRSENTTLRERILHLETK
jgi:FtsZ-binding cell division protein ZapB